MFRGEPCGVFIWRDDTGSGVHAIVTESAELSTENGIGSGSCRGEVDMDGLAGDRVLFEAQLGDGETVDDVQCPKAEIDLAVGGKHEFGGHDIVFAMRVRGIDADGISFAGGDELRPRDAEDSIRAGIAEIPSELHPCNFDLKRGRRGSGVTAGGPKALGFDGKRGEEDREGREGDVLEAYEVSRLRVATEKQTGDEKNVRESGEGKDNPKVEEEMVVKRGAVRAGICRQPSRSNRQNQGCEAFNHTLRILRCVRGRQRIRGQWFREEILRTQNKR